MRTFCRCRAVLFLTLLTAAPLLAQERCKPGDTISDCLARYKDAYVQAMEAETWKAFESQPSGVDTGGANLATTKKDFSPLMALSALLGQGTIDEGTGTVVYDLNFLIPKLAEEEARNAQLEAVVNMRPQISERILNKLQDGDIEPLEDELSELADFTIRFTYNHTNDSLGRSFAQHKDSYEAMCRTALRMVNRDGASLAAGTAFGDLPADQPLEAMSRADEMKARERFAAMEREMSAHVSDIMRAAGLTSYHELVDNQPQFHATAERRFRDPLVGPDETSVKVTYEGSWRNLNRATAGCTQWDEACLQSYMRYVETWREQIEKGYRFSVSGEYFDSEGETVAIPDLDPIVIESARKLVFKAGWGRNFNIGEGEPIQLDLVGSYEDVSDDPDRQDRGIVRLTLTRNVGKMSIPFGIVYANHGEFLDTEGADARFSAHIGLTFKMKDQ